METTAEQVTKPLFATEGLDYYVGRNYLFEWVNKLLGLNVSKIEQFASGALYCQIFDAYFPNLVAIKKVNFLAKEEYEILPNYKILQAALSILEITKELNISSLSQASNPDNLEFLQWLFKHLKGRAINDGYDPFSRRLLTGRGVIKDIPLPNCVTSGFDIYGRPEAPLVPGTLGMGESMRPTSAGAVFKLGGSRQPNLTVGSRWREGLIQAAATVRIEDLAPVVQLSNAPADKKVGEKESEARGDPGLTIGVSHEGVQTDGDGAFTYYRNGGLSAGYDRDGLFFGRGRIGEGRNPHHPGWIDPSTRDDLCSSSANTTPTAHAHLMAGYTPLEIFRLSSQSIKNMHTTLTTVSAALIAVNGSLGELQVLIASPDAENPPSAPGGALAFCGRVHAMREAQSTLLEHSRLALHDIQGFSERYVKPMEEDTTAYFHEEVATLLDELQRMTNTHEVLIETVNECSNRASMAVATGQIAMLDNLNNKNNSNNDNSNPSDSHKKINVRSPEAVKEEFVNGQVALDAALKSLAAEHFALSQGVFRELAAATMDAFAQKRQAAQAQAAAAAASAAAAAQVAAAAAIMNSNGGEGREEAAAAAAEAAQAAQAAAAVAAIPSGKHAKQLRVFKLGEDCQVKQLRNGDVYKGHYHGTKKNGDGMYCFANGDVYEGCFLDDRMHGYGVYVFSHEGRYEGSWNSALYAGAGTETFTKGSTYHGEYDNGLRHGWGVCRFFNGDFYEGQWASGLRNGVGVQQCMDGSNYVGDYIGGKRHGLGIYSFPNGDLFLGQYEDDLPHGYGVYRFASGQCYRGQWASGKKHGWSSYSLDDGNQYLGQWVDGKPSWVQPAPPENAPTPEPAVQECLVAAAAACDASLETEANAISKAAAFWKEGEHAQDMLKAALTAAAAAAEMAREARRRTEVLTMQLDAGVREHLLKTKAAAAAAEAQAKVNTVGAYMGFGGVKEDMGPNNRKGIGAITSNVL